MIHPVNLPVYMSPRPSVYDSPDLFGDNEEYFERARGTSYGPDGRRLRDGVPTTPTTPRTLWTDVFRRSLINRLNSRKETEEHPEFNDDQDQDFDDGTVQFTKPFSHNANWNKNRDNLELEWADLKIRENAEEHHTSEFHLVQRKRLPHLVLRRGQVFRVSLHFSKDYEPGAESVELLFELGARPSESKGTRAVLDCTENSSGFGGWAIKSFWRSKKDLDLEMITSPSAVVGCWTLKIVSSYREEDGSQVESICTVDGIYLLFNPWCKDDSVFMDNKDDLEEYVMNDVGKIWRGSYNSLQATIWSFGQFEDGVLEACMFLLERSDLPLPLRASPVYICRAVSQMVNSKDDNGVLVGKWGGDFRGGTNPALWTGSSGILRQFGTTGVPVKYGQCWIFAGVVTSVLRCLGIPSRVVSNYSSAHDTDNTCTVDIHFSADSGKILKELNVDSVWNFHVWNDCWMERHDLPPGYGGWQAIDATPQEKSEGLFRVGPASLRAIKEGEVAFAHDTGFVFAEVNADKCYWEVNYRRRQHLNDIKSNEIGRMILTRRPGTKVAPGNDDRMDVTDEYKYSEMTLAERRSMMNALLMGHSQVLRAYQETIDRPKDVVFELDLEESATVGQDFFVSLRMRNTAEEVRTVKASVRLNSALYTGEVGSRVKSDVQIVTIPPNDVSEIKTKISVYDYLSKMLDQCSFLVSAVAHVLDTDQIFATTDTCRLQKPPMIIKVTGEPRLHQQLQVILEVFNPLPVTLTNCRFMIEGPGLLLTKERICGDISPHGYGGLSLELKPWKAGERFLVADFDSDQLCDVQGSANVFIRS